MAILFFFRLLDNQPADDLCAVAAEDYVVEAGGQFASVDGEDDAAGRAETGCVD